MPYRVVVVTTARRDLHEILDWLKKRSPDGAERWLSQYRAALASLAANPLSCAMAPESDSNREIRQTLFRTRRGKTYRAIFVIQGTDVRVLRVRGPGQDILPSDELI